MLLKRYVSNYLQGDRNISNWPTVLNNYGWKLVKDYQTDDLAEDDEDEKRITKAEKSAEKKATMSKRKKVVSGRQTRPAAKTRVGGQTQQGAMYRPYCGWDQRQAPNRARPSGTPPTRPVGPCFSCGEYGHLRSTCPRNNQTYPSNGSVNEVVLHGYEVSIPGHCTEIVEVENIEGGDGIEPARYWEAEHSAISVKGRLKENAGYWSHVLKAPKPILEIIHKGYILPLMSKPDKFTATNHQSVWANSEFVDNSIEIVHVTPLVCSPLLVVESSSGKKRLVINLRYLNRYLWKDRFKYEDIRTALNYFQKGDYIMFTFDLKSGCHHVDIHESSQNYLGFSWGGKHYVFTLLPFGLSTACYIFTKLLKPIVKLARSKGVRLVVYTDDGIGVATTCDQTTKASNWIEEILDKAGLVFNTEKSRLAPAQAGSWLGFDIDLGDGVISIPGPIKETVGICQNEYCQGHG